MGPARTLAAVALWSSIAVGVGCGGGSGGGNGGDGGSSSSSGSSSGGSSGSGSSSGGSSGSGSSSGGFQTTCDPNIDVSQAAPVTPGTVATYPIGCLAQALQGDVAVVSSSAAFTALFAADGGAGCTEGMQVASVDFTKQRLAVLSFPSGLQSAHTVQAYDTGSAVVVEVGENEGFGAGGQNMPAVMVVPLPVSAEPVDLVTCVTTCVSSPSNPCPA